MVPLWILNWLIWSGTSFLTVVTHSGSRMVWEVAGRRAVDKIHHRIEQRDVAAQVEMDQLSPLHRHQHLARSEERDGNRVVLLLQNQVFELDVAGDRVDLDPVDRELVVGKLRSALVQIVTQEIRRVVYQTTMKSTSSTKEMASTSIPRARASRATGCSALGCS